MLQYVVLTLAACFALLVAGVGGALLDWSWIAEDEPRFALTEAAQERLAHLDAEQAWNACDDLPSALVLTQAAQRSLYTDAATEPMCGCGSCPPVEPKCDCNPCTPSHKAFIRDQCFAEADDKRTGRASDIERDYDDLVRRRDGRFTEPPAFS